MKHFSDASQASQVALMKNPPAIQEVQEVQELWVGSPGGEGPLEKGMATHPSVLVWRIPWTEEPAVLQCRGCRAGLGNRYKDPEAVEATLSASKDVPKAFGNATPRDASSHTSLFPSPHKTR